MGPTTDPRAHLAALPDAVGALAALLSAAEEGVVFQDAKGRIQAVSRRAQEILGVTADELLGVTWLEHAPRTVRRDGALLGGDDHPAVVALRTGAPVRNVALGIHQPDGGLRWVAVSAEPVRDGAQEVVGVVCTFLDHTDRLDAEVQVRELMDRLAEQALTDPLTGLPNRRAFDARLAEELARARRHEARLALAVVDVDAFKALNDTRGHPAGDLALVRLAEILRIDVRQEDIATRLAGDEFAVILPGVGLEDARAVVQRVRDGVGADDTLRKLGVTLSVGVAELRANGTGADLYRRADAALYAAKAAGGDQVGTDR